MAGGSGLRLSLLTLLAGLVLASCEDQGIPVDEPVPPTTGSLRLRVTLMASDARGNMFPVTLGVSQHETEFGNAFMVSSCRFFLSHVGLDPCDGNASDFGAIHYVDADDPSTLQFEIDSVERGHYCDLVFTFGLDDDANVTGALPARFDTMAWPQELGGGYQYLHLEGEILAPPQPPTAFAAYAGRLPAQSHFFEVRLTPHLNVIRDQVTVVELILDVNQWFKAPHTIDLDDLTVDTRGDAVLQQQLDENGADVFGLGVIGIEETR